MIIDKETERLSLTLEYDPEYDQFHVKDRYGEFLPIPGAQWMRCVENPYHAAMGQKGIDRKRILDIFLGDIAHRYICNN